MGGLMTGIDEIDGIQLIDIPKKRAVQVTAIRQGDTVILKFDENRFAVTKATKVHGFAYPVSYRNWQWQEEFINLLVRLKMIKAETADIVHEKVRARDRARLVKYERDSFETTAKQFGINLTKQQMEKFK